MDAEGDFSCTPPPGPPPLLSEHQMLQLAQQGWLSLTLTEDLANTAADLFKSSSDFFNLPDEEKVDCYPPKSGTEFGYYSVSAEKEYITYRCRVQTAHPSHRKGAPPLQQLEDTAAKVWQQCASVLFRILCDLARWSHLDLSVWDNILDGTLTMPDSEVRMTHTLLRLFRYLPTTGSAEMHTDLGLLTVCIGNRGGLEVLDRIQSTDDKPVWVSPASESRTATILTGQTLKSLSNGTFSPGIHRIVGNPEGRNSVVFALRHSSRHDVDFGLFGGDERVPAAELWKFLEIGKVNINTVKQRRDAQRAKHEAFMAGENTSHEISTGRG